MLIYLIKSGLCLLVLFSFYKLLLENEQFHGIKRTYLISSILVSLFLPLITITYGVEIIEPLASNSDLSIDQAGSFAETSIDWKDYISYILVGIYLLGFLFFAFRFGKNLISLIKEAKANERVKEVNYIFVLLGEAISPHSFFKYIFLNKTEFRNDKISTAVIEHEKAHVDQKHSLDLIFIEILQVFFWFNPLFFWLKKAIKLNHEFLADKEVLSRNFNALEYSNILFNYSSGYHHNSLSSPINHSLIKKRIIMITKSFSLRRLILKVFIFLPILGCCIYLFNQDIVARTVYAKSSSEKVINHKYQVQDKKTISIRVENEKIWLNNEQVKINEFSSSLDEITKNWTINDLKNTGINMKMKNSDQGFIERLNKEFSRSRIAKVSGRDILPPPPPLPPAVKQVPPPPAPAPEANGTSSEPLEPGQEHQEVTHEQREMREAHQKLIKEERQKIREIEKKLIEDENLTRAERKNMLQEMRIKEAEIHRKMREVERRNARVEREHMVKERVQKRKAELHRKLPAPPKPPAPPAAPDPIESINKLEERGGSFSYNGKKVSAKKARKIVRDQKYSRIEIRQGSSGTDVFEIMD